MNLFNTESHTPRFAVFQNRNFLNKGFQDRRRSRPTTSLILSALLLVMTAGAGCTSHEEKATLAIEQAVQSCRDASADEAFYAVERFDGKQDEILRAACLKDLENFEITNNLTASANTGPVVWNAQRSLETDAWSVGSVEWPDLERARRAVTEHDPTEEQLGYANTHLQSAQEAVPESAWIRLARLDALLKLRTKTRSPKTLDPTTIGAEAQKHFDETLNWAKANNDLDTQVEAQYMVVQHLQKYLNRVEMILESDGSSDEWLIKSAEVAEKDGKTEEAEKYRQELEGTQEKRAADHELYTEREVKLRAAICAQVTELSPAGVKDASLAQQISAKKESIDCMERAAAAPKE